MTRQFKISAAQAEAIMADQEPNPLIAARYGITVSFVRAIKRGEYDGHATQVASPKPARRSPRFYEPFRDGTYAR